MNSIESLQIRRNHNLAAYDERVSGVIAFSRTSVVWSNIGPGKDGVAWPERSSWSLKGALLDFVPAVPAWERGDRDGLLSYRPLFEQSLNANPTAVQRAQISTEKASADIVLVAGGMTRSGPRTCLPSS